MFENAKFKEKRIKKISDEQLEKEIKQGEELMKMLFDILDKLKHEREVRLCNK